MTAIQISQVLDHAIKLWASDIHISEWENIWFRVDWKLWKANWTMVTNEIAHQMLKDLLRWDENLINHFLENRDLDFAFIHTDKTPFRINAFYKLWRMAFVMRKIASKPKSMDELGLPEWVKKFTKAKQWLILVTWPTWSGKSTSMISILDAINKTRREHILTIEDPVEFIFQDDQSIFSQREIWKDTKWFAQALRAAMREDPDIVMVWEMRDKETVEAAMELAETGHLVISTLHTAWSVQTITRLVNFFHPELQHSVRYKLWDILFWVLSQRLIPKADWKWRAWIYEIMMMTPWIKSLVRSWDLVQINNAIEMGRAEWMIWMKNYADSLRDQWIIKEEDYINYFQDDM